MAKLKAVFGDKAEIPSNFADFYTETDGKWVLDVEPVNGFALEDITSLKSALGKERKAAEDARKLNERFGDLDPVKARDALAKIEEFAKIDPEKEADRLANERVQAATKQLVEKHTTEVDGLKVQNQGLMGALDGFARRERAATAISRARGNVEVLLPHVLGRLKLHEDNGQYTVRVVDGDGNPRIADSKGSPMTVDGLVDEMRQDKNFAPCFQSGKSGSGLTEFDGTTGPTGYRLDQTAEEKNAIIRKRLGQEA